MCARRPLLFLLLLLLLLLLLPRASPDDLEPVSSEVIVDSGPCGAVCGVGLRNQTLCVRSEGGAGPQGGAEQEWKACRVRRVKCLDAWRCGLETLTVREGTRLEINCLGEVMQAMGRYSWRVSWRYARGVITSDDRLFSRLDAPYLDRVVLEPVSEQHAGTYRCDVQDSAHRRGKRAYWGVRVLPPGVVDLEYPGSPAPRTTDRTRQYPMDTARNLVLVSLGVSAGLAGLTMTGLYWVLVRRVRLEAEEREPRELQDAGVTGIRAAQRREL